MHSLYFSHLNISIPVPIRLVSYASFNSLHIDDAPRNITPTMAKPLATLNLEQKLLRLGKSEELKENYPEKEADQKMRGSKRINLDRYCTYIYYSSVISWLFIVFIIFYSSDSLIKGHYQQGHVHFICSCFHFVPLLLVEKGKCLYNFSIILTA